MQAQPPRAELRRRACVLRQIFGRKFMPDDGRPERAAEIHHKLRE